MSGCPSTSLEVKASSDSLKCVHPEVYHCLRDQVGEKTEKCIKPSWIQKGLCAEYNTIAERLDAKTCRPNRGLCPAKAYLSNDVISYSGCAPKEVEVTTINTTILNENHTEARSAEDVMLIIGIIIPLMMLICIVVSAAVIFYHRRQRNVEKDKKDKKDGEPLMETGDEEKEEHLKKEEKHLKYFMLKGECTTYMLNKTKKCLQDSSNVFIVGKPGSGKTTLAWTVCKESHGVIFKNRKWYVTLSTEKRTLPENCEVLLLLDGAFENPKATEDVLNRVKEFKNQLQSQQLLIIATISHHAYKKIKEQKCINDLNPLEVIDLDDKNNLMTRMEMSAVFMSHGITIRNRTKDNESEARIINESQVDSVYNRFNPTLFKRILTPPLLGFPLIATLMALKPAFLGNIDFVQSPIQYVISSINELKSREKEDKNRYCTIVYAALFDGYLNTNDVKQDVLKAIGDSHGNPEAEINTEFYVLRERSSGMYEFIHESIFHAFLAQYSYRH